MNCRHLYRAVGADCFCDICRATNGVYPTQPKATSMLYSPIMALSGDWRVGVIENHMARPLTRGECDHACNVLNRSMPDLSSTELRAAIARSPFDLSLCCICGKPTICIPDGQPICEPCADREAERAVPA